MADSRAQSPLMFALMASGILMSVVVAFTMVKLAHRAAMPFNTDKPNSAVPTPYGVTGIIKINEASRTFQAPSLDLFVDPGVRAPDGFDGAFHAEFTVTFDSGYVQYARLGAEIQGGSIIVMRGGEVLLSDYAGPESAKLVLTRAPVQLSRRREQVTYIFQANDNAPVKLRAIWQPEDADQPRPLGVR